MLVATLLLARTSLTDFDLFLGAYVAILACLSVAVGHYTVRHLSDNQQSSSIDTLGVGRAIIKWTTGTLDMQGIT